MTLEDLINKLREEKGHNGCYYVFQKDREKLKEYVNQRNEAKMLLSTEPHKYLCADGRVMEKYNFLDGFLWGLQTAEIITAEECSELHDELWEETRE